MELSETGRKFSDSFADIIMTDMTPAALMSTQRNMAVAISAFTQIEPTLLTSTSTQTEQTDLSTTSTQTNVEFSFLIDELSNKNNMIYNLHLEIEKNFSPNHMSNAELKSFSGFEKETFFKIFNFVNLEEGLSVT